MGGATSVTPGDVERMEEAIDRFEEAWRCGDRPAISDHLPDSGPRFLLLVELVHVDLENHLKAGEAVLVEDYLRRFPELGNDRAVLLDLLAAEWTVRRRLDPGLSMDDYLRRFPDFREELSALASSILCPGANPTEPFPDEGTEQSGSDANSAAEGGPGLVTRSRYRRFRLYARGGLGEIFAAVDDELGREVAVKQLQWPHARHPESRGRFLREARITSQLEHPGVVPVYGLGRSADGGPCYAMRLIRGETFHEAVERFRRTAHQPNSPKSIAFRQLLGRLVSVCNTVAYAHSRGVLHRDLKPGNILLGHFGETLVVDWGLATRLPIDDCRLSIEDASEPAVTNCPEGGQSSIDNRQSSITCQGSVVGTPAYMSPEQAGGCWERVGPGTDVYGLGATLYYLLTGRPPFAPEAVESVLEKVQRGEFPKPRQVEPTVCPALEAVCLKAMAPRPEDRYATALQLAAELEHWLAGEPVGARREPWLDRLRRWAGRHRAFVAGAVVTLVAGAALTVVVALLAASAEREKASKVRADAMQEVADVRHAQLERAALEQYFYHVGDADRAWKAGRFDRATEKLEACESSLRAWEWNYLNRKCRDGLLTLKGHTKEVWGVAYSPDGKQLASASLDGTVKVWDATTGRQSLHLDAHGGSPVWGVAWRPDGKQFATAGGDGSVKLWDGTTGTELLAFGGFPGEVFGIAFSRDGLRLAAALGGKRGPGSTPTPQRPGEVRVWDLGAEKEILCLSVATGGVTCVGFSPDGKALATGGFDRRIRLWDVQKGKEVGALDGHVAPIRRVEFSPDGRRLASASNDGTVRLWDVGERASKAILRGHTAGVWGVAFSPDGTRLASSADDCTVRVWDVDLGRTVLVLHGHTQGIANVAFSPDGTRLASAGDDQTVRVWDATGSRAGFGLCGHEGGVTAVAFGRDGRLATVGNDRTMRVWDTTGRRLVLTVTLPDRPPGPARNANDTRMSVALSPDGSRVAAGLDDGTVRIWDAATGREVHTLLGHTDEVHGVTFSPNGRLLASGSRDRTVMLWDAETGREVRTMRGHSEGVRAVAFAPDGKLLASGGDDRTVRLWDTATGREELTLTGPASGVACLAFAADGRRLAAGTLSLRKVITWEPGEITLWELASGRVARTLRGHFDDVRGLAFSPDGRRLASAGADGRVKLWEPGRGQEVVALIGHFRAVNGVSFSPDGRHLASAGDDGTVIVWNGAATDGPRK